MEETKIVTAEDMKAAMPVEEKLFKVDLACGQVKEDGWIGIDCVATPGVDIVHDLTVYPWPLADNSVDEIRCSHYIEHVEDIISFMNECYRILKPGAKATFYAPYYTSVRAVQDPTHVRAISGEMFLYYNKKWREDNKLTHGPYAAIKADFDFGYSYSVNYPWSTKNAETVQFAITHYWNVVADIICTCTKRE